MAPFAGKQIARVLYCPSGFHHVDLLVWLLGLYFQYNQIQYNQIHINKEDIFLDIIINFSLICIRIKINLGVVSH